MNSMKKITLLMCFIAYSIQLMAQPSGDLWLEDVSSYYNANTVTTDGKVFSTTTNYSVSKLYSYNNDGTENYNVVIPNIVNPIGLAVDNTGDNIYITGSVSPSTESRLVKINANTGAVVWSNSLALNQGASNGWSAGVAVDSGNNVITINYDYNDSYYRVVKHNDSGTVIWDNTYNVTGAYPLPKGIAIDTSDNIIVTGQGNTTSFHLLSINSNGTLNWRVDDTSTTGAPTDVLTTSDNSVVVVGSNRLDELQYARKYDSNGNLSWEFEELTEDGPTLAFGVTQDTEGNLLIGGRYNEANQDGNPNTQYLNKLSVRALDIDNGNLLWTYIDNSNLNNGSIFVADIALLSNGNIAMVGDYQQADGDTSFDIGFTIVYSYDPSLGIDEYNDDSLKVFPNPAKNEIRVKANKYVNNVSYKISNMLGQIIKIGDLKSMHTTINVSDLSKGNYIITLKSEEQNTVYKTKFIIGN